MFKHLFNNLHIKILISVITIFLVIGIIIILKPKSNSNETSLTNIGRNFYENFYYKNLEILPNKNEFLNSLKDDGIKFDLNDMSDYIDENKNEFNNCNKTKTFVIIYPKEPYDVKSYDIKVELNCN